MSFVTSVYFFFNDTATTEIYTLSLHDALPICVGERWEMASGAQSWPAELIEASPLPPSNRPGGSFRLEFRGPFEPVLAQRSEEHTSELQSRQYLVCRLLLEKKKQLSPST